MRAFISLVAVVMAVLLASVQGFAPTNMVARSSVRASTIVMDGKSNGLKDRIKSIKNTRRITEAMRLVAAARVRRAQEAVLKTRPLIGQLQMVFKTVLDACKQEDVELPILEVRDVKKISLVLVTGDRGLCGGYNSYVIKQATKRINKLKEQGIDVSAHRIILNGTRFVYFMSLFFFPSCPIYYRGVIILSLSFVILTFFPSSFYFLFF